MSDWIRMSFKEISKDKLLDYCIQLGREMIGSADEIIKKNVYYIPSIRLNISDVSDKEYRVNWREADRNWLYQLFSINLVYWEKYSLLGIVGTIPEAVRNRLTTIEFQNSTDQNYDYDSWHGINYFEAIVKKIMQADAKTVALYLNQGNSIDYDEEDIKKDIEYYRKTAIYDVIYKTLELHEWLWKRKGNFNSFCLQAINSQDVFFELATKLEAIRKSITDEDV